LRRITVSEEHNGVEMNDTVIIRQVQNGDTEAFSELVQKYHQNLLSFIHRLVRDQHRTDDIGQEVFLSVYKSLSKFDPERGTPFVAWLYIIARNRCISELRAIEREKRTRHDDFDHMSLGGDTAEEELIRQERFRAIEASLDQLPEPFRTTILKTLEGDSPRDIACECGIPQSTVKTRLFRARVKIKQLMNGYIGGVGHERRI